MSENGQPEHATPPPLPISTSPHPTFPPGKQVLPPPLPPKMHPFTSRPRMQIRVPRKYIFAVIALVLSAGVAWGAYHFFFKVHMPRIEGVYAIIGRRPVQLSAFVDLRTPGEFAIRQQQRYSDELVLQRLESLESRNGSAKFVPVNCRIDWLKNDSHIVRIRPVNKLQPGAYRLSDVNFFIEREKWIALLIEKMKEMEQKGQWNEAAGKAVLLLSTADARNKSADQTPRVINRDTQILEKVEGEEESVKFAEQMPQRILVAAEASIVKANLQAAQDAISALQKFEMEGDLPEDRLLAIKAKCAFEDRGDGTILDRRTGMIWTKDATSQQDFRSAVSGCNSLNLGGLVDWRVPTIGELTELRKSISSALTIGNAGTVPHDRLSQLPFTTGAPSQSTFWASNTLGKAPSRYDLLSGQSSEINSGPFLMRAVALHKFDASTEIEDIPLLHVAAAQGYERLLQALLKKGADVNWSAQGQTPLTLACVNGQSAIVQLLLENKADPNATNGKGESPLLHALLEKNPSLVELLLKHKASPAVLVNNYPAIVWAIANNEGELVELLLQSGIDPNLQVQDPNGRMAQADLLAIAIRQGSKDAVVALLLHGAIPPAQIEGRPSLIWAIDAKEPKLVEKLLADGADPNLLFDGAPALNYAAYSGNLDTVEALLTKGAKVNNANTKGEMPLDLALGYDHPEVVANLLKHGAFAETKTRGQSIFVWAIRKGHVDLARQLLEGGADPNTMIGKNPLLNEVAAAGKLEMAQLLVEKGANVNSVDERGLTPVERAIGEGETEVLSYLLQKGGKSGQATFNGDPPLVCMAKNGQLDKAQILLKANYDINVQSKDGVTPLMAATSRDEIAMVEFLLKNGADRSLSDKRNRTAADYLKSSSPSQLVMLINGAPSASPTPISVPTPQAGAADPNKNSQPLIENTTDTHTPLVPGSIRAVYEDEELRQLRYKSAAVWGRQLKTREGLEAQVLIENDDMGEDTESTVLISRLQVSLGNQTYTIEEAKNFMMDSFTSAECLDFDGDGAEDIAFFFSTRGLTGRGLTNYYYCVSSAEQKGWIYTCSNSLSTDTDWTSKEDDLVAKENPYRTNPKAGIPYVLLEYCDATRIFPEAWPGAKSRDVNFVYVYTWNGSGFSYSAVPEIYSRLLPLFDSAVAADLTKDASNAAESAAFAEMHQAFALAATGKPFSDRLSNSSTWELVYEIISVPVSKQEIDASATPIPEGEIPQALTGLTLKRTDNMDTATYTFLPDGTYQAVNVPKFENHGGVTKSSGTYRWEVTGANKANLWLDGYAYALTFDKPDHAVWYNDPEVDVRPVHYIFEKKQEKQTTPSEPAKFHSTPNPTPQRKMTQEEAQKMAEEFRRRGLPVTVETGR